MSIVDEIWKDIPGYEGYYQVSSLGRVRSCDRVTNHGHKRKGQLMKPRLRKGYLSVGLRSLGQIDHCVHKLVAIAFLGDRPEGFYINHIDGDKLNNCFENLEYCTSSQNAKHAFALGLRKPVIGNFILSASDVLKIRFMVSQGLSDPAIASIFGVSSAAIRHVRIGKTWKHI